MLHRLFMVSLILGSLATSAQAGTLTATWDPPAGNPNSGALQSYKLYRKTQADPGFPVAALATVAAPTTTYVDTTVTDGTQYCYVVTAVYQGGETPPSTQGCGASFAVPTNPPINIRITFP